MLYVYKNMEAGTHKSGRALIVLCTFAGMLLGLFLSRALLSISMLVFFIATLVHRNFLPQVKICLNNKLCVAVLLLFFVPAISGLWSSDKQEWANIIRIKAPLLLFPFAFAGNWQLSQQQWKGLFYFFILLTLGGCFWSLGSYLQDAEVINESYLRAKAIPTPFENDHVRFSWAVAVSAAALVWVALKTKAQRTRVTWLLAAFFFTVYLHVLSARTGLFCFYFFLLFFMVHLLFSRTQVKMVLMILATLVLFPVAAWFTLRTFQNRVRYIVYEASFIMSDTYLPGGNDGNRMQSLKAGWSMLAQHPFGVGAGDVRATANEWYSGHVPGVFESDKLLPSSEWLVYGAAAGWPGLILFTGGMLLPFALQVKGHRTAWVALSAMGALSFLFDPGLEVQFGVFLYLFVVFCCAKYLRAA